MSEHKYKISGLATPCVEIKSVLLIKFYKRVKVLLAFSIALGSNPCEACPTSGGLPAFAQQLSLPALWIGWKIKIL
jgi:hypothetical protein